ncbi:hypothetical protein ACFVAG_02885 [Streptomyces sp. NPDC057644]|uniref:hypothetical protein n=1 Tax=Streptomyces sp. NPDC057644 TaxID=3346191 RepID=UPI0036B2B891
MTSGIHLGTRTGSGRTAVALPIWAPRAIRIGVLGESLFGRLLACRLVAAGAEVTAVTRGPSLWAPLASACGPRLTVTDSTVPWPGNQVTAPGSGPGPRALVTDLPRAPSRPTADGAWTTLVHITRRPPARSTHWSEADAVIVLGAAHAEGVAPVLGAEARELAASLAPGEIALFRHGAAVVLRPDIAPAETALLRPD